MLGTADFPVNYFTISEMEQWFPEDYSASFLHISGKELVDGQDFFWCVLLRYVMACDLTRYQVL
jgi:hypothetical protein